jgi:pyridoxine 5-phosphate synthase
MTKLSVNINKVATLRNSRGGSIPNVVRVAIDAQDFGADGMYLTCALSSGRNLI